MTDLPKAEILSLGNELLIGRTVNTNATYLSNHLTKLGFQVTHVVTVRDEEETIIDVINWIIQRKPSLVIVNGGLGPTHDDIQLSVLSQAFNLPLILNELAVKMLEVRYGQSRKEFSDYRKKMALLPQGAKALKNTEGSAPGVLTRFKDIYWISLPGVPREMKAIFNDEVKPFILDNFDNLQLIERGFNAYNIGESSVSIYVDQVMKAFPNVYVKSHPRKRENQYWLSFHIYAYGNENLKNVESAANKLKELILQKTPDVSEIQEVFSADFEAEYDVS